MKILQINKYNYIRGGADSVYFNTIELLRSKGHEVIEFAMDFPKNEPSFTEKYFAKNNDFTTQGFAEKIKNLPSFFYNKDASEKLEQLIIDEQPDIAHLHLFYGSLTSSILKTLKKHNIPIVTTLHDYKMVCSAYLFLNNKNEICEDCKGKKHIHTIKNNCIKGSRIASTAFALEAYYRDWFFPIEKMFDQLIFVSEFSRQKHLQYRPEFDKISSHVYNFDPTLDKKMPSHQKGEYFLFAGRLSNEKGLKTLISAFQSLPHLKLIIAGKGPLMDELKPEASGNITFAGFQKPNDLQNLIKDASFVIVPSECYENNPMAIIEAYALGKPVIGTRIGGIPEIIVENETGFLFDFANSGDLADKIKMADNLTDDIYETMSRAAVRYAASRFNPNDHYQQLMDIYEPLVKQRIN